MKRTLMLVAVYCINVAWGAASESASQDYAFAQQLLKEDKQAFALLEFERTRFFHKGHPRAADAAYEAAWLYLTYAEDPAKGKALLTATAKEYPDSDAARRSEKLSAFLDAHGDFGGRPLAAYLKAQAAGRRGNYAEAEAGYGHVYEKYPDASLAEQAMVERGKILITEVGRPREGLEVFRALLDKYPKTERYQEVYYFSAVGVEKMEGPGEEALDAYRRVVREIPDTEWATQAQARIKEIEKSRHVIKRKYDKSRVQDYTVVEKKYPEADNRQFLVIIEVPLGTNEKALKATLEDALIKHYLDRKKTTDTVRVEAYYNHPVTEAGSVDWRPGKDPEYAMAKREAKDVVKDIFLELLKNPDKDQ